MKLFDFFKSKCLVTDDAAHTTDNVYSAKITADNVLEDKPSATADKLEAAKNYLGEKYILHPKHNVKRKNAVKHFTLETNHHER
jgi:hypothetical protein